MTLGCLNVAVRLVQPGRHENTSKNSCCNLSTFVSWDGEMWSQQGTEVGETSDFKFLSSPNSSLTYLHHLIQVRGPFGLLLTPQCQDKKSATTIWDNKSPSPLSSESFCKSKRNVRVLCQSVQLLPEYKPARMSPFT